MVRRQRCAKNDLLNAVNTLKQQNVIPIAVAGNSNQQGKLGWFGFPTVDGGKGDVGNLIGGPCNYYSIASASKSPKSALTYLKEAILNDTGIKKMIELGEVPVVQGIETQLTSAKNSDWLKYVYQFVQKAPNLQLSLDQAFPTQAAQTLLTNLDQLFLKQITPQQFSDNMNKTITAS